MVLAYGLRSSSLLQAPLSLPQLDRRRFVSQRSHTRLAKRIVWATNNPDPPAGLCVIQLAGQSIRRSASFLLHSAGADLARDFSKFVNETGAVTPLKTRR